MHYIGLFFAPLAGIAGVVAACLVGVPDHIIPVFYVAALLTHPLLEHNSNKPFADRPLWSAMALLRTLALDLTGGLHRQIRKIGPDASCKAAMTTAIIVVCMAILGLAAAFHFLLGLGRQHRQRRFASASRGRNGGRHEE